MIQGNPTFKFSRTSTLRAVVLTFAMLLPIEHALADAPFVDPKDDLSHLGPADRFLFWTPLQRTASFRNIDKIFPTRPVRAGAYTLPLPTEPEDFSDFRYRLEDQSHSIRDFMDHTNMVGLLILKDGQIAYEKYLAGNTEDSLWVSFSMAKSVTSMLIGAAIKDGYIENVDEPVTHYLPRLAGSSYANVSIRNVLQMASGVAWDETYDDPDSDVNTVPRDYLGLAQTLAQKERVAPPGEKFNYNTGETNLAGAILRAAIGNNASTYLEQKIWQPFGMESDANWMLDAPFGGEMGGCCLNVTLRDYARLGLFAMNNGRLADGTSPLPDEWMAESVKPSKGADQYGYLWWLLSEGTFTALGIYGQTIHIDPANNLIVVTQGSYDSAVGDGLSDHRASLLKALSAHYAKD